MKNSQNKWFYLVLLSLIWGTSFILIKKSLLGLSAFQMGALRTIITGFFLFLVGYKRIKTISSSDWKWLALSGFLGSLMPAFLFAIAETEIDSAIASMLNSLVPIFTLIMGASIFHIKSTKRQLIGVMIGFVGTAVLIFQGAELNPDQNYLYVAFIIVATIMYAANVNIIKRNLQHVKPLTIAVGNYATIVLPAVLVLLFSGFFENERLNHPELKQSLIYVVILSFFGTAVAKVLFNKLVHMSSPVFASSVTYLMPVIALVWGVIDGEKFGGVQIIGSALILLGVYLAQRKNK